MKLLESNVPSNENGSPSLLEHNLCDTKQMGSGDRTRIALSASALFHTDLHHDDSGQSVLQSALLTTCPLCLTMVHPDRPVRDEALLRFVECWNELPTHIRSTVLTLVAVFSVSKCGNDSHGGVS